MGEQIRCPYCGHISTVKVDGVEALNGIRGKDDEAYFVCQNPKCNVERIYGENMVMVSGAVGE